MREGAAVIRLLVRSSVRSRGLVAVLGLAVLVFGVVQVINMPKDVLPEFGPPTVEVQTEALGLSAAGGRAAHHHAARAGPPQRRGVPRHDPLGVAAGPVPHRADLRDGHRHRRARQVVNERLTQAHGLPNVSKPPQMLQPRSSTSRVMMVRLSATTSRSWSRPAGALDDPAAAHGRPGCRQRRDMGHQRAAAPGAGRPRSGCRQDGRDPRRRSSARPGNALWVSPLTFLEASTPGAGGFYDTASQRIGVEHIQPIQDARGPGQGRHRTGPERAAADATGCQATRRRHHVIVEDHQPLIGDAVFTDGARSADRRREAARGQRRRGHRRAARRPSTLVPGLAGIERRHVVLPARPTTSRTRRATCGLALLIGLALLVVALVALPVRAAATLWSAVGRHPRLLAAAVLVWRQGETLNAMVARQDWCWRWSSSSTTRSNSACASGRRTSGEDRERSRSPPSCGAVAGVRRRCLRHGHPAAALIPLFVLGDEAGAFFPIAATCRPRRRRRVAGRRPDLHAGVGDLLGGRDRRKATRPCWPGSDAATTGSSTRLDRRGPTRAASSAACCSLVGARGAARSSIATTRSCRRSRTATCSSSGAGRPGTSLPGDAPHRGAASRRATRICRASTTSAATSGAPSSATRSSSVNSSELWVSLDVGRRLRRDGQRRRGGRQRLPGHRAFGPHLPVGLASRTCSASPTASRATTSRCGCSAARSRPSRRRRRGSARPSPARRCRGADDRAAAEGADARGRGRPRPRPRRSGIKPGDVRRSAATVLSGIQVGNLFEEQKVFDVMVWGTPETRGSRQRRRANLSIDKPAAAARCALAEVADVRSRPEPQRHPPRRRRRGASTSVSTSAGATSTPSPTTSKPRSRASSSPSSTTPRCSATTTSAKADRLVFLVWPVPPLGIFLLLQAAIGSWLLAPCWCSWPCLAR